MNKDGWLNMQTSGDNLFGTLSGKIILDFNVGVTNLTMDIINGSGPGWFAVDMFASSGDYESTKYLASFGSNGSVWHFTDFLSAGISKVVILGGNDFAIDTISWNSAGGIPEPATLGLIGSALAGLGLLRLRRKA